jgi:hypothetical protein
LDAFIKTRLCNAQSNKNVLIHNTKQIELGIWVEYFFGLWFLLTDKIEGHFVESMSIAPLYLTSIVDYILDNYIFEDSQCPQSILNLS